MLASSRARAALPGPLPARFSFSLCQTEDCLYRICDDGDKTTILGGEHLYQYGVRKFPLRCKVDKHFFDYTVFFGNWQAAAPVFLRRSRKGKIRKRILKEPLNQSSSAECRIFYHIRALQKVGNTYSISPLFEGSAEAKSLGIRACRLNQRFPRLQRLPGRLLWFLSCRDKKGTPPAGSGST